MLKAFLQPIIKELDFNQTMILNHPKQKPQTPLAFARSTNQKTPQKSRTNPLFKGNP
ncbi:hypothetical protein HPHPM2_0095 [Helicobacter pylori Hp M2]|uniref:Uncharacterized protein n=1 Tax=Helicobacter pylori Hp H-24 TaxID=992039 RepID=J0KQY8_HELPX|nr:hypothetical protein HPHPH24_0223 [Helicobacter pylori Hp H-24]EJC19527.1 hypothetical protein HPHPH24B_0119 [Helicobacter pylori Hp H-24b]EJC20562.1 hypothetical protein HPHPH24C_0112 [Helicobacter pylori Hp H-24c]EJC40395.1 hypothetical protein HPHPM1_0223 [Helicobacter pylori Hp M1]EJC42535.1 hypothetical protein HPHPM2_0095 [Helicobacter pylori Hp M2]EJC43754.1 hypothetical protein HPHPM3_0225 [Helicobacter pylori Hp M3]EJC45352.1 hypothetical protein HPHPM4_0229 [Helicobacter pylori H